MNINVCSLWLTSCHPKMWGFGEVNKCIYLFISDQLLSWQLAFKTYLQPHHPNTGPVLLRGTGMMPWLEHLPPTSVVKDYSWPNAIQYASGAWKKVPSRTSNLSSLLAQFERDQTRSLPSRSLIRQIVRATCLKGKLELILSFYWALC